MVPVALTATLCRLLCLLAPFELCRIYICASPWIRYVSRFWRSRSVTRRHLVGPGLMGVGLVGARAGRLWVGEVARWSKLCCACGSMMCGRHDARWGEVVRRDGDGDGFAGRAGDAARCPVPRKIS